jgi:RNA polymerase sigma factor (TIGR02999 family)
MLPAAALDPAITSLLNDARRGDREAEARLFSALFTELRRTAAGYLRRERPGHTLSPTALVNEAYIKLTHCQQIDWRNRAQFFGTAARVMRRILVDHARAARATKRGGGAVQAQAGRAQAAAREREPRSLDSILAEPYVDACQILAIDQALDRLADLDARQARIVECRCFAGLDVRETAEALGVSPTTVKREWQMARAWLYRELYGEPADAGAAVSATGGSGGTGGPAAGAVVDDRAVS